MFSGPDEDGEGEHKIFEYIRKNKKYHKNKTTIIYGLDADLIILSLNHLHISNKIYLCREMLKPVDQYSSKNQNKEKTNICSSALEIPYILDNNKNRNDKDDPYLVDIDLLAHKIQFTIINKTIPINYGLIHDYVFLSFFLGNDFMPKFPVLNLRTKGIGHILKCYKELLLELECSKEINNNINNVLENTNNINKESNDCHSYNKECNLLENETTKDIIECEKYDSKFIINCFNEKERKQINWSNVFRLINYLSKYENTWAYEEYINRENFSKTIKELNPDNVPILYRFEEKYIAPIYPNWEERYYIALFLEDVSDNHFKRIDTNCDLSYHKHNNNNATMEVEIQNIKKQASINFLEGLEWCTNYYSFRCINYNWFYKYDYAPLLVDLVKYVPNINTNNNNKSINICKMNIKNNITPNIQLSYVLPKESYDLLEPNIKKIMDNFNNIILPTNIKYDEYYKYFRYSYTRYLWEAHLKIKLFDFNSLINVFINYPKENNINSM